MKNKILRKLYKHSIETLRDGDMENGDISSQLLNSQLLNSPPLFVYDVVIMEIQKQVSLKPYTTFAVDVLADFFVEVYTEQDIFDLISLDVFATQSRLIL